MEMAIDERYTLQSIIWRRRWTDKLLSFRIGRPTGYRFAPGQFARLGLKPPQGGEVWRAYSMCSASTDDYLEFYSIVVPQGQFTPLLSDMQEGSRLMLDKRAMGFFDAYRLPPGKDLWLLATGTGLAPYLSILQDPAQWQRFERIVLAHCVRYPSELSYQAEIEALRAHPLWEEHGHKLTYLPVATRDTPAGMLGERIPALLQSGALADAAGLTLAPEHSRFMLCGNPQMVEDTHRQLMKMGFRMSRQTAPGQIVLENGW